MTDPHLDPDRRHDVVFLFDVTDGNPNGDPDGNNAPRTDDETGHGLVTDVAIKRKIRDTIPVLYPDEPGYSIFVEAGIALNTRFAQAIARAGAATDPAAQVAAMYYDARMFGAVLTQGPGKPAAQIRGPVQVTFSRSIDPVMPVDHAITRVTQSRQADIDKGERTELGQKWTIPYGLYRGNLFYSPSRATKTGVTTDDLAALWRTMQLIFELDRTATRGVMALCGLYVFSHRDRYGVAPWKTLDALVSIPGRQPDGPPARRHTDYQCTVDDTRLPDGVDLTVLAHAWN
ncbi:type I-C CRISPR-associated protein Cas7/Csd2 [Polymorphospora sp. NPDC050346]|uniref:type I-C CRISPR-associated protein Cas7/Csd2 n=1 Tax=Polymorphospora sp. NPDC050346 TaxID=3155780 RepID=UPI0033E7B78F